MRSVIKKSNTFERFLFLRDFWQRITTLVAESIFYRFYINVVHIKSNFLLDPEVS